MVGALEYISMKLSSGLRISISNLELFLGFLIPHLWHNGYPLDFHIVKRVANDFKWAWYN